MELPTHFKVLYTKHVRQKRKVYQDGYLSILETRSAHLFDDRGQLVASGRVPQSSQVDADSEALTFFESLLVNCDEKCCSKDIPKIKPGRSSPALDDCGNEFGVEEASSNRCKKKSKFSVNGCWVPPQIPAVGRRRFLVPVQTSTKRSTGDKTGVSSPFQLQSGACVNSSRKSPRGLLAKSGTPTGSIRSLGNSSGQEDGALKRSDEDILAIFLGTKQPDVSVQIPEGGGEKRGQILEIAVESSVAKGGGEGVPLEKNNNHEIVSEENCNDGESIISEFSRSQRCQKVEGSSEFPQPKSVQNIKKRKFQAPRARPPLETKLSSSRADATGTGGENPKFNTSHDADQSLNLKFPSAWENWTLSRRVDIPDCFWSLNRYRERWGEAIEEELNIKLGSIAKDFHSLSREFCISKTKQMGAIPQHHPCHQGMKKNVGGFQGMVRKRGMLYHAGCELEVFRKKQPWGKFDESKNKDGFEGSDGKKERMFLKLKDMDRKATYRKFDLWILSNTEDYSLPEPGQVGDKSQAPWTAIFFSLWHGPSNEGKIEVELISRRPSNLKRGSGIVVSALQGPQANLELAMKQCLLDIGKVDGALMDFVLTGVCTSNKNQRDKDSQQPPGQTPAAISKFGLNCDQAEAVWHAHSWLPTSDANRQKPPVCLIHGPFGSGKSTLLVSIIHTLTSGNSGENSSRVKEGGGNFRVLVSAHTNVAVDRVLIGLMESGFTDFIRVGSLPKIAKPVLKHSVHCSEGGGGSSKKSNAATELRKMLKECVDRHEQAIIRQELAEAERGAERVRRKRLQSSSVVGVTCCSSSNPLLADLKFDVVILDEASQMTEPLSLMPIIRAKARFLIAAGDPCQLPPVIARPTFISPGSVDSDKERGSTKKHGLFRPLFVRLASVGCTPILLRHQYRCHPELASLPNRAFYNGHLLSGTTPENRPSLVENWQPLISVDVRGCASGMNGSISNRLEAQTVASIAKFLNDSMRGPCSVGVICFFKQQVSLIENTLMGQLQRNANEEGYVDAIQVATVDSFQGMEKDIIILSTSITQPGPFCSDAQRLNVALTRGKHHMVLVGCLPALQRTSAVLNELISKSQRMNPDCSLVDAPKQAIVETM